MLCFSDIEAVFLFIVVYVIGLLSSQQLKAPEPYFMEPVRNVTVAVGRDITLSCIVENIGSYKVAWMKPDRHTLLTLQDQVITRNPRYKASHNGYHTWWLHINEVREEDAGLYMCQVNASPMINSVGYLTVVVPPVISEELTSSDSEVREGKSISLRCVSHGNPEPRVTWRREDGDGIVIGRKTVQTMFGEYLNITKVTKSHIGAYLCIANNTVPPTVSKRILLNVIFEPMLWIPNQLVGVPMESDVLLACNIEASPAASTTWLKNGNPLPPDSETDNYSQSVVSKGSYKVQLQLKIAKTQSSDFGSYTCVARNELGETEGTIRLYVIPKPKSEDVVMGALQNTVTKYTKEASKMTGAEITTGSLQPATLPNTRRRVPTTERNKNLQAIDDTNSSLMLKMDNTMKILLSLLVLKLLLSPTSRLK